MDSPWEGSIGGIVLGSKEFAQQLLKEGKKVRRVDEATQTSVRQIQREDRLGWATIVSEAEAELGRSWQEMENNWGDWGRDGTLYVAVRHGRQRLADVVRGLSGLSYGAGGAGGAAIWEVVDAGRGEGAFRGRNETPTAEKAGAMRRC